VKLPRRHNRRVRVEVRPPKIEDAEGLARVARDLGEQYSKPEPERFQVPDDEPQIEWYRSALEKPLPENSIWLVAEVDGEAVGDAQAQLHGPAKNAAVQPQLDVGRRRVYLNWLAVQTEHRSHGIGGRLLEAVEEWAYENGAELIVTDTNLRSNVGAVEFYESHGYEKQAVVLRKRLT
jgi:GNAT superfamily N-acetyltransferase